MYKQFSIIFVCFACLFALSGCGIKGPLYQAPPEKVDMSTKASKSNVNSSTSIRQDN